MIAAVEVPARWIHRVSGTLQYVGVAALVAMILLSASDVIYRNVVGGGITASIQINEMLMVAVTFGALAATQMHDGHVAVDLFTAKLGDRLAGLIHGVALLVVALVTAWASWASWHIAVDAWSSAEVSIGIVNIPTWPSRFLVAIGLFVLTLELVVTALESLLGQPPAPLERELAASASEDVMGVV